MKIKYEGETWFVQFNEDGDEDGIFLFVTGPDGDPVYSSGDLSFELSDRARDSIVFAAKQELLEQQTDAAGYAHEERGEAWI